MSKIAIRRVDATSEKNSALLRWLQLEILPMDVPMSTNSGYWWVALDNGQPVAFCGLARSSQWTDAGYLCRAGVIAAARGHGLQKKLIRVRELKARALGWRWLVTDTYNNPASANSLIGCGFKMFTPSTPWGGEGVCYWKKEINA